MKVFIRTEWPDVAIECLEDVDLLDHDDEIEKVGNTGFSFWKDDSLYRDMVQWIGSAQSCGLILAGMIEER